MKVDSQLIASTSTELRGLPLRQGQVLAAIVLRSDNAKGEALLSLAGGQLSVQTRLPLQAGSALQLNVRTLGPPLVLQPLPGAIGGTGPSTTGQNVQTQLLTMLFQRTSQMAAQYTSTSTASPTATGTYSNLLSPSLATANFAQAPAATIGQMTTTATTTALLQSGTGTALSGLVSGNASTRVPELTLAALPTAVRMALPRLDVPPAPAVMATTLAKLVTTYSLPTLGDRQTARDVATGDLKTQLKLAAQAIKTSLNTTSAGTQTTDARPGTIPSQQMPAQQVPTQQGHVLNTLNEWVNHLDISQLRTALQQVQGQASWIVDLPVVVAEQPRRLQLAVNQEEENDGAHDGTGSGSGWQLDFSLDLPELGPLHGSLHLQSADLTVRLYADAADARQRLSASLDRLDAQLRRAHLNPQLSVYPGPPPAVVQARLSPEPGHPDDTTRHSWRV